MERLKNTGVGIVVIGILVVGVYGMSFFKELLWDIVINHWPGILLGIGLTVSANLIGPVVTKLFQKNE